MLQSDPSSKSFSTPEWALERIREAIAQGSPSLDLSRDYLSESEALTYLPQEILELSKLRELTLSGNDLSTLPEWFDQLRSLNSLNMSNNMLHVLPESVSQLHNLTSLDVSFNNLSTLPGWLSQLHKLTSLNISDNNNLGTLSESVSDLHNLTNLAMSGINLSTLPELVSQLHNLMSLDISFNRLSTLPEWLSQLHKLIQLDVSRNSLRTLPESINQLHNLRSLDLRNNHLSTLPESISQLYNLTSLDLRNNHLSTLPESIGQLYNLTSLNVKHNPLVNPPIEVVDKGIISIREYFRQIQREGIDYLYEAKLLILGEAGAGKTTLANKILDSQYALRDEDTTKGVTVLQWTFPIEENRQFRVNIWDFGGQEIYHATHQFFLTRRSLYVLVVDTRKDDTDFYYWLNIAELLSDGSPLLIIKNEKQDRHREINQRLLKGQFDSFKDVFASNLATNRGLERIRQEIEYWVQKLPHIGTPLPKTWVHVRELLEKDPRNYVPQDEYLAICKANGFTETKDALQLSGYLHDIGVFLHYQDDSLLKRTVILKPKWGNDAVYKVLDNRTVIRNLGRFTRLDLDAIWNVPEYETMHDELLQLMMKFRLCYEIPTQKERYIAPQLLTENQPEYKWKSENNLLLRYTYEFMPKGIITQFIVAMHQYIWGQRIVWKSGVVIEKDNTYAEVIEYYDKREIRVRVVGQEGRDLMTIVHNELEQIHSNYSRLRYDALVPCSCPTCKGIPEPNFYKLSDLKAFRVNNQFEIQCYKKPYHMMNVLRLLGDMIDLSKSSIQNVRSPVHVHIEGDKTMTEIKQTINHSTIQGSVIAAESIKDSLNMIQNSAIQDYLKEQLQQLTEAVEIMARELPKDKAEEVADDMKRLAEEATKEKPSPKWYNVSIDGLVGAAQNLGTVGDAVIELAGKVRRILMGGLI